MAEEEEDLTKIVRERAQTTVADAVPKWSSKFSPVQIELYYEQFGNLDLDDSGAITPSNLAEILKQLEVEVTEAQVKGMICEAKGIALSDDETMTITFSDFLAVIAFEREKEEKEKAALDMRKQLVAVRRSSVDKKEDEPEEPPAPVLAESTRTRGSSIMALNDVASARIAMFQAVAKENLRMSKATNKAPSQRRFESKLNKFKRIEEGVELNGPAATVERCAMSLKQKLNMFDQKNAPEVPAVSRTWKKQGHNNWKAKTQISGGPPPKKSLADLP